MLKLNLALVSLLAVPAGAQQLTPAENAKIDQIEPCVYWPPFSRIPGG